MKCVRDVLIVCLVQNEKIKVDDFGSGNFGCESSKLLMNRRGLSSFQLSANCFVLLKVLTHHIT